MWRARFGKKTPKELANKIIIIINENLFFFSVNVFRDTKLCMCEWTTTTTARRQRQWLMTAKHCGMRIYDEKWLNYTHKVMNAQMNDTKHNNPLIIVFSALVLRCHVGCGIFIYLFCDCFCCCLFFFFASFDVLAFAGIVASRIIKKQFFFLFNQLHISNIENYKYLKFARRPSLASTHIHTHTKCVAREYSFDLANEWKFFKFALPCPFCQCNKWFIIIST